MLSGEKLNMVNNERNERQLTAACLCFPQTNDLLMVAFDLGSVVALGEHDAVDCSADHG
jgi:hypothetical protein